MELKPEAILTYLGFEADKVKTDEEFKAQFEAKFGIRDQLLKDTTFTSKIFGQRLGSIEAKLKSHSKKMGIDFTPEEIKDKPVEDIMELSFTKIAEMAKKAMEDMEKSIKAPVEEQAKTWKDMVSVYESKIKDTEGLLAKTANDLETSKKEYANKVKVDNINNFKNTALGKLEFKQDISPVEKMGFESVLNDKYDFDLDENQSPFIKDKKTGQRIASKKVIGQFMTADEIFQDELIANKLAKINKDGGKIVSNQRSPSLLDNSHERNIKLPLFGKAFTTASQSK